MINKELLKIFIYTKDMPFNFPCPTCSKGSIMLFSKDIKKQKTAEAINSKNIILKAGYEMFRFVAMPTCNFCSEVITISGAARFFNELNSQTDLDYLGEKYLGFTPIHIYPPLNIISIPTICPIEIKECLVKSFSHYWYDLAACANTIRNTLEIMMDIQGIQNQNIKLHDRLKKYQKKDPENGKLLIAIKWIGNAGSHSQNLSKDHILHAFELIETVIDNIYERPEKLIRLHNISDKIIENKGPIN
jgi:hypothetical protein